MELSRAVDAHNGGAEAQNGALEAQMEPCRREMEPWRLKMERGGPVGQWSQIRITLIRSRIRICIKVNPDRQ
jgi:hypothetical protein